MVKFPNRARPGFFVSLAFAGSDMWESFAQAFCLMMVIEGIIPFLYPNRWRRLVMTLATVSDRQMRMLGLTSMLLGVFALYLLH